MGLEGLACVGIVSYGVLGVHCPDYLRSNSHDLTWLSHNPVNFLLELTLYPVVETHKDDSLDCDLHLFLEQAEPLLNSVLGSHTCLEHDFFLLRRVHAADKIRLRRAFPVSHIQTNQSLKTFTKVLLYHVEISSFR